MRGQIRVDSAILAIRVAGLLAARSAARSQVMGTLPPPTHPGHSGRAQAELRLPQAHWLHRGALLCTRAWGCTLCVWQPWRSLRRTGTEEEGPLQTLPTHARGGLDASLLMNCSGVSESFATGAACEVAKFSGAGVSALMGTETKHTCVARASPILAM